MRRVFQCVVGVLATAAGLLAASSCWAGPTVSIGINVPSAQRGPVDRIDHSAWDAMLKKYVDANGYVDYPGWKTSVADQKALDIYLNHLSAASFGRESTQEGQLAFWINAYNALTVYGILREYPTTSIRNHTAKLYGYNIWKDLQLIVAGKSHSLEGIEHEILRKMGEPRIHFAIVCASVGCPRLLNEAFTADRLEEQLTANAKAFFADPAKFVADPSAGTVKVSPILEWFGKDFGEDAAAQLRSIAPYLPKAAQPLARRGSVRMTFLDYDWSLNDQAKLRSAARR